MTKRPSARQPLLPIILLVAVLASPLLAAAQGATASARPPLAQIDQVTLTVFAAASLTDAFQEIGQKFELDNPGVKVEFNFAGSQVLSQQLNQGAAADVFASASAAQMNAAVKAGRVSAFQTLARNRLIVIYPGGNPGKIDTLKDLAQPGLQIVLAASSVPVGQYALDFLDKASAETAFGASFKTDVLGNVVSYEDNVKAVLAKVALGEADAGIVYATDVLGPNALKVRHLDIPDALNTVATYPIASLDNSAHLYWARSFVRFALSQDGQMVLWKYGFVPNWTPARPKR